MASHWCIEQLSPKSSATTQISRVSHWPPYPIGHSRSPRLLTQLESNANSSMCLLCKHGLIFFFFPSEVHAYLILLAAWPFPVWRKHIDSFSLAPKMIAIPCLGIPASCWDDRWKLMVFHRICGLWRRRFNSGTKDSLTHSELCVVEILLKW